MPSGHKIFDWSPQSEIKLFHAILAVHRSQIDYDAVAKVFGSDIPASCISRHIKYLRGKSAATGIIEPKSTQHVRHRNPAKGKTNKSGKSKIAVDDADDDDENEVFVEEASTPSKTTVKRDSDEDGSKATKADLPQKQGRTIGGRITKLRSSPRKVRKVDYQALERFSSPTAGEDGNGEKAYGKGKSSDDDTMPSDGEYTVEMVKKEVKVKAEI